MELRPAQTHLDHDRGMVSEDNLEFLRERGVRYPMGTPKSQRKAFEAQLLDNHEWAEVQPGVDVAKRHRGLIKRVLEGTECRRRTAGGSAQPLGQM
ncbi:MAG: hypothetical protein QOE70_5806 [Chthoniobacter sp.]|nr:hypothetical protein [Chthoniobacter sp.]